MTHICVSKLTIIGSDNGLSPDRRQAIIWTNAGLLLIGSLGRNFSGILIEILTFSFKKMRLKVSSAKWRPFCLGLNVLIVGYNLCIIRWCALSHEKRWFVIQCKQYGIRTTFMASSSRLEHRPLQNCHAMNARVRRKSTENIQFCQSGRCPDASTTCQLHCITFNNDGYSELTVALKFQMRASVAIQTKWWQVGTDQVHAHIAEAFETSPQRLQITHVKLCFYVSRS